MEKDEKQVSAIFNIYGQADYWLRKKLRFIAIEYFFNCILITRVS